MCTDKCDWLFCVTNLAIAFCLIPLWLHFWPLPPPWNSILLRFLWQNFQPGHPPLSGHPFLISFCELFFPLWDLSSSREGESALPVGLWKWEEMNQKPMVAVFHHLWKCVFSKREWSQAQRHMEWRERESEREQTHERALTVASPQVQQLHSLRFC